MTVWNSVLQSVNTVLKRLEEQNCSDPFFRGHSNAKWTLKPGLGRNLDEDLEGRLYFQFISLAGHLIPAPASTWDIPFLMQHHGLPTRLLDWTESFSVALYFAVRGAKADAAIWILDPYKLNQQSMDSEAVQYLDSDFPIGYEKYFIDDRNEDFRRFPAPIVAVAGSPRITRMRSQRGVFTIHRELRKPLDALYPETLNKIVIPRKAFPGAKKFLQLAGINESTVFPDLDGIARYLKESEID